MNYKVKICEKCHKNNQKTWIYTSGFDVLADEQKRNKCIKCNSDLKTTILDVDEYAILEKISNDVSFFDAMLDLKEKDIIEFNLKISQFKSQVGQQQSVKVQNDTTPKCPNCSSTNINPISGLNRGVSVAMWGIFSKKINKSYECKNCKYTW